MSRDLDYSGQNFFGKGIQIPAQLSFKILFDLLRIV